MKALGIFVSVTAALAGAATTPAHRPAAVDDGIERLYGLAELYGAVRYFHPALVTDGTGWDAAVAAAVVPARAASTPQAYARAVDAALRTLADPASRVLARAAAEPRLRIVSRSGGVLVLGLGTAADVAGVERLATEVAAASRIVFELRSDVALDGDEVNGVFADASVDRRLAPVVLQAPTQRTRSYSGFPPEAGQTSGGYQAGWRNAPAQEWQPLPGVADKRIVFVIGEGVPVPAVALALQRAGRTALLVEGTPNDAAAVLRHRLQLPHALSVAVRTGELVAGIRADSSLVPARDAASRAAARTVATRWLDRVGVDQVTEPPQQPTAATSPVLLTSVPAAALAYPDAGWRAIAAFRVWNTFRYFFPYRHLIEADWDATLRQYLPRVLAAPDSLQYGLAIAEMLTHTVDSHVNAGSLPLGNYFGTAAPPVRVRIIEGEPVVTGIVDDSVARAAGIAPGDVIVAIDGEPAAERFARIARYTTTSTPQWLNRGVANRLLSGAEGEAVLTVRNADGQVRQAKLPRRPKYRVRHERTGDIVRILPGNIGYVDLDRLPRDSVDVMFERLRGTRGIIFDMRGYPQGTAWSIAPRLTERTNVTAASFRRNVVTSPDVREITSFSFDQALPPATGFRYTGPTVMLIDERAISQSEHTGLFLKAANNTVFVGSPTAGANGDVTTFMLPGRIGVTFTGHDVRWPDGRQLQRVGLIPDVPVQPTIAGIRAGRDEVLERAIEVINDLAARATLPAGAGAGSR